jgi:hypothetical protein
LCIFQINLSPKEDKDDEKFEGKEFSVVSFKIFLKRIRSYFVLTTYMPSTLFVFVSWISFAMPVDGGERAGTVQ